MRKVRDYDAELRTLETRARKLKAKRIEQLGQLVVATGADTLDTETLAGALLDASSLADEKTKEVWRAKGELFFRRRGRKGGKAAGGNDSSAATQPDADPAPGSGTASH